jgi:uncharacterized membrane protein YdjX (TVP38/TMEM64 family)
MRASWAGLALFLLALGGLWLGLSAFGVDLRDVTPERVRTFVLAAGAWAPFLYLGVYSQPLVPLPASALSMAGGLAFGPVWGMLVALAGATSRALAQFGVAQLLGREQVSRRFRGRVVWLDRTIGERPLLTVCLVRVLPNLPFDLQNYALALSGVRFVPYAWGTALGLIPSCTAFAYAGYALTDPARLGKALAAAGLILLGVIAPRLWRHPTSGVRHFFSPLR